MTIFLIFLSNLLAFACLYSSWRWLKSPAQKLACTIVAWLFLALSLYLWIGWQGPEFGTLFGVTLPSMVALVFVAFNRRYKPPIPAKFKDYAENSTTTNWRTNSFKIILVVFFAAIVSFVNATAFAVLISESHINAMVISVTLALIAWGGLAFLLTALPKLKLILSTCSGLTLISLWYLYS